MRVGYLGPEGTFSHEAVIAASGGAELELVALPTIYDTVMAVHNRSVERALVPIENSLEGSVNATLDALAIEAQDVAILGEVVQPIRHCLIARTALELAERRGVDFAGGKKPGTSVNRSCPIEKVIRWQGIRQRQVRFEKRTDGTDILPVSLENVGHNLVRLER